MLIPAQKRKKGLRAPHITQRFETQTSSPTINMQQLTVILDIRQTLIASFTSHPCKKTWISSPASKIESGAFYGEHEEEQVERAAFFSLTLLPLLPLQGPPCVIVNSPASVHFLMNKIIYFWCDQWHILFMAMLRSCQVVQWRVKFLNSLCPCFIDRWLN